MTLLVDCAASKSAGLKALRYEARRRFGLFRVFFTRGSAPIPGSVARGVPCAPLRSVAVISVHHRSNTLGDEQLGGVGCPTDRLGDRRALVRVELRCHVIREIAPVISATDPDPQPCKFFRP